MIQYVYGKYGRHRAALAATVISYRGRSAIRDVARALGLDSLEIDRLARTRGLMYAPDPGSGAYCRIGGNLAMNAAGPRAVKYGATRDHVLGLSAVTGDGRVIHSGGRTTKYATAYDLTRLLVGSEGTLAYITQATLKLLPAPETVASIIYTSGTTGKPKGAMLTHANFCADIEGSFAIITDLNREDRFLVVLPLFHAFSFTANFLMPLSRGSSMNFVESLRTVADDIRTLQPSVLMAVPLLVEKVYDRVEEGIRTHPFARLMLKCGLGKIVGKKVKKSLHKITTVRL